MTQETSSRRKKRGNPERFPLFPLRDIVIFPHMVIPLFVGREKSVLALEAAMAQNDKLILLATQKNAKTEDPEPGEIYTVGTLCQIIQLLKLPDGTVKVLVEGKKRGSIVSFSDNSDYFEVEVETLIEKSGNDSEVEALKRGVLASFENYIELNSSVPSEILQSVQTISDPSRLADTIAPHLNLKVPQKQELLAAVQPARRIERLLSLMGAEIEILQIEKKIHARVKKQMEKTQKDYYLNEQIRAIQKELGGKDEFKQELRALEAKAAKIPLPIEAKQKVQAEIKKLKFMSPMSAEAAVVRNYVDWLLALPWGAYAEENKEIAVARARLEADHYGLEKVKLRILEYLAVNALAPGMKGPILCLVGPPGVGKTSLARSVAKATGRDFVKMSLGGVRDEAEIRGHRRTYIGALPGRIIQEINRAGSNNPVFMLDEVDKIGADFRGDPASALLEVLDPEQNFSFTDHYLDVPFDLTNVMFITTANQLDPIPAPLKDRMEVITLSGYTDEEKLNIAKTYLVGREIEENGLSKMAPEFTDEAIYRITHDYTREAGVRNLQRNIASVCRKIAKEVAQGKPLRTLIDPAAVSELLGPPKFYDEVASEKDRIGVATGLAWTESGGDIIFVEATKMKGKEDLILTGSLGEVMKESARAALSFVKANCGEFGIEKKAFDETTIHIHVPAGSIPKDGPSAGITMATTIVSLFSGRPAP